MSRRRFRILVVVSLAAAVAVAGWRVVAFARMRAVDAGIVAGLVQRYAPAGSTGASPTDGGGPDLAMLLGRSFGTIASEAHVDRHAAQALTSLRAGKAEDAEPALTRMAEAAVAEGAGRPADVASRQRAGDAFLSLAAIQSLHDPAAARSTFERAATLDPDNPVALGWHGWLSLEAGRLEVAQTALTRLLQLQRGDAPAQMWSRHWALLGLGDIAARRGQSQAALDRFTDAAEAAGKLLRASTVTGGGMTAPDPATQRALAVAHQRIGDVLAAMGNLASALESYRTSHATFKVLADRNPDNTGLQYDLAVSHLDLGVVESHHGDLAAAIDADRAALAIAHRLIAIDPHNGGWLRLTAIAYQRAADVLATQGQAATALEFERSALGAFEQLAAVDPGNAGWQRDRGMASGRLANRLMAQGEIAAAVEHWQAARRIAETLAASDPANAQYQRDRVAAASRVAAGLHMTGDLDGALASYDELLPVEQGLAAADPADTELQRNIAVLHKRAGDVLMAQTGKADHVKAALERYTQALAIDERLAASDPANATWQRDLADACTKSGAALAADGALAQAYDLIARSVRIAEAMAARDPANASWQMGLGISLEQLGDVQARGGERGPAVSAFERALGIYRALAARNPDDVQSRLFMVAPLWRLGELEGGAGRARLEQALSILEPLEAAGKLDAGRRDWLVRIKAALRATE